MAKTLTEVKVENWETPQYAYRFYIGEDGAVIAVSQKAKYPAPVGEVYPMYLFFCVENYKDANHPFANIASQCYINDYVINVKRVATRVS